MKLVKPRAGTLCENLVKPREGTTGGNLVGEPVISLAHHVPVAAFVAQKVEGLATWKLCNEIVERLNNATATGRVAKDYKFCDQINDAAGDALSDVAEGFARFYPRDFAHFLDYAVSSLEEVRTRVTVGYQRKYFDERTTSDLIHLCYRAEAAAKHLRAYLWSVKKEDLPARPDIDAIRQTRCRRRPKR
jgi:four helix bundle protein